MDPRAGLDTDATMKILSPLPGSNLEVKKIRPDTTLVSFLNTLYTVDAGTECPSSLKDI
jgi:hypothetical protein